MSLMRINPRMISIALLIVLLAIVGGVYAYSRSGVVHSTSDLNPQSNLPEDTSSVVINSSTQTNAWKAYVDTENGFSFNYPKEFVPDVNTNYPASGNVMVHLRRPSYGDWSFSVNGAYNNQTLETAMKDFPFRSEKNFQQTTLLVGNKKYQQLSYENGGVTYISIFIPRDNGSYLTIDWKSAEDVSETKTAQNSKEELYALLSTFKLNKQ